MISVKNLLNVFFITLFFIAMFCLSGASFAATCPSAAGACAANTLCVTAIAPTARVSGATLPASEISGYVLAVGSVVLPLSSSTTINYSPPMDSTIAAGTVLALTAVDTGGLISDPATCTTATMVAGPKSRPSAPASLKVAQ